MTAVRPEGASVDLEAHCLRPQGWEVEGTAGSSLAFVERREGERELEQQRDLSLLSGLWSRRIDRSVLTFWRLG